MGKNKQAQRTKNNARPSNSSRSAELLGTAVPNFVGFSAVKDGGYVPVLPGLSLCSANEVEMNSVDSSFQVVLKKMSKKDATTKYKALQEFATLCQDAELPAVEGMLSFWPRLYCALSIDIDHRVREAAQLAHAAVVKRIGKGIAMYLKQLAGAWFTSQYDAYPPAASAAVNSFNNTFPPRKMVDAIVHCQCEILAYVSNNITVHTAQTLSAQKSLTNEEMEARYERVLIANLQAYSFYFKKVPLHEIEKNLETHNKLLSSSRFWKLAKHDALPIRTAFFNVLTSVMDNAEKLLQSEKKRTVTAIMNNLDESEPGILSAVWESMLVATTKIDDWHLVVNIEKLVLPKLWRVLRSGGQCCASTVYPNLLPFVSQFPKLGVPIDDLYINFFDNMRQGFSVRSVQMSRSETLAVVTSFAECLRYSILVNAENVDLCIRLLKEQLVPVIEACMTDNTAMKPFCFAEITHLVRYWSKNRGNEAYKSYVPLIQQFWIELRLLFDKLINISRETAMSHTVNTRDSQIEFLLTLKTAPDRTCKKLKVKFSDSNDSAASRSEVKVIDVDADAVFDAELCELVNALSSVNKLLIDVAKEVASLECDNLEKNQNLILLAFETSETGDLLISEGANKIVSILCDSLNGSDNICSVQFVTFIMKLMTLIWSHEQIIPSAVQILETLFELCTRDHDDSITDTVRNSWKEGLVKSNQILSDSEFNDLIKRCAIIIWSKIYTAYAVIFDRDVSDVSWNQLFLSLEVIRLLTTLIQKVPSKLNQEHWDFILISFATWQQSLNKSKHNYTDIKVTALMIAVSQLYCALQTLMNKHEQEPMSDLPPALLDEWKNVFANEIHSNVAQTWIIQLGAYHALKRMIPEFVRHDKVLVEFENFELSSLNIKKLEEVLLKTQNIVNTMLMDFKLCDAVSCTIQPFTDSYTYTLGYLLVWAIVLDICANSHSDLRCQYAEILKDGLFPCLLNNIFKLMPLEVLQDNKNKTVKLMEIFTTAPSFNFGESWTESRLDHITGWLYTNCLRHLPVLVRQWLSTADSRVNATIDKITTHYVSPMLCQEELLDKRLVNVENMQIKVHPTAREVVALYQMDDTKLELSIVLPPNHPLGIVTVEPGQHAGGTANWRNCHMQLSIFLTHQVSNLDKKFAGVEECYICFSIFHISTYQIPKLSCHTCRKKFHTPCLYKWFNTSQKSTCPICRNVF
ncbi:E3 ubiquitin-protein ligase listerin [Ooceraea biroi]|uniref:E3 ubiquitin-protein ligase listerin n=1 Tax=Ooceraea biroi TaxID=2015173 RepID=A0A026VUL9_OOCBI|nr:E3 ubiquitin-protein ligase listerin [Ooceraea biroi]